MSPRKDPDPSASVPCFYGAELRFLRESAGLTLDQLVEGSFRGAPLLSRIERGELGMPMDLAVHVDKKLKTGGFFERHCEKVQQARRSGLATYFADVAEMEVRATTIEEWAPGVIPGLLQTEAYVRRLAQTGKPWLKAREVERLVRARVARADFWKRGDHAYYWGILQESLIRRPTLPPDQMADQLDHIAAVIRSSESVLQLLPEAAATGPIMMGDLRVMTFPDAPVITYTENAHSGQVIDFPPLVMEYRRSYDLLRAAALSPEASLAMVEDAARGYRHEAQQQD
ncbi:transcriptional regulator [Streptomyces albospinus]|uniref:Transcriptional regulator n=1 Tax=Streptomyces albospinus TaxID=285515 RepID=A0ABQ2VK40_9ACTN|nr:helix-turn-helix transcriptional regulator [Streptomyces albospinus]GGU92888.1 transcriptional regulator [Streptomyces albospinus]